MGLLDYTNILGWIYSPIQSYSICLSCCWDLVTHLVTHFLLQLSSVMYKSSIYGYIRKRYYKGFSTVPHTANISQWCCGCSWYSNDGCVCRTKEWFSLLEGLLQTHTKAIFNSMPCFLQIKSESVLKDLHYSSEKNRAGERDKENVSSLLKQLQLPGWGRPKAGNRNSIQVSPIGGRHNLPPTEDWDLEGNEKGLSLPGATEDIQSVPLDVLGYICYLYWVFTTLIPDYSLFIM